MEQETLVVKKLIVGTEGRPEDEQTLTALCASLDGKRVHLRLVHVLTVARTAPLDVPMPEAEQQADRLLARSKKIAERFHIPVETAVLRGREVGACLIEEARRAMADAICMRFRSRAAPMGHYVVSATVSTLLNAAPCPVITFHVPHRSH